MTLHSWPPYSFRVKASPMSLSFTDTAYSASAFMPSLPTTVWDRLGQEIADEQQPVDERRATAA